MEYLVGMCFHEPDSHELFTKGILEDFESSTGVFIDASCKEEAIAWGEAIGENLLRALNNDESLSWKKSGYFCWIEEDISQSGWEHCLGFFQHVNVGDLPDLDGMSTIAYEKWLNENGHLSSKLND